MKRNLSPLNALYRLCLGILPVFMILLFSCKKESAGDAAYIRFANENVTLLSVAGTTAEISIESNSDWKITVPAGTSWLELNKTTGHGNDHITLKAVDRNTTGAMRQVNLTASLTSRTGTVAHITVEQEAEVVSTVTTLWKKVLGGNGNEIPYAILNTADGGQLVAGKTSSNASGDVTTTKGGEDYWIVKLDAQGQTEWQKSFGGPGNDIPTAAGSTTDGGYIIAGSTTSDNAGDVGASHGSTDCWVIKINAQGMLQWQKTLGGDKDDVANAVAVTTSGAVVIAGYTKSNNNGDVGASHGNEDYWIVQLNAATGAVNWTKTMGDNGIDKATAIVATANDGVIIGGNTASDSNGDVPATKGGYDFWIIQLDKDGNTGWQKTLGGSNQEDLRGLAIGTNGTVVAVGATKSSNSGEVGVSKGGEDFWVVQLNTTTGALNWQKTLGGTEADVARHVAVNTAGNIIVSGHTYNNNNGDVGGTAGGADYWIVQLSNAGNINWKKTLGGLQDESVAAVTAGTDGSYVMAGYTYSDNTGEVGSNHGNSDYWIVKLKE